MRLCITMNDGRRFICSSVYVHTRPFAVVGNRGVVIALDENEHVLGMYHGRATTIETIEESEAAA